MAGTRQLTSHDRKMISVASRMPDLEAGPAQEERPAQAAEREAESRRRRNAASRSSGFAWRIARQLVDVELNGRRGRQDEQDERQDEREDRPRLAQPAAERQLVGADGSSIGARRRTALVAGSTLGLGSRFGSGGGLPRRGGGGRPRRGGSGLALRVDVRVVAPILAAAPVVAAPAFLVGAGVAARAGRAGQAAHRSAVAASPAERTRPLPRARWTSLASGVSEPDVDRRPARDELGRRERGEQAGRRRQVAVEHRVGDPDLERAVGVGHRDPGQSVGDARTRPRAGCPCRRRSGRCGSRSSRPGPRAAPCRASRSSDPRNRSNGWGTPTSAPWARARRDRLVGRQAGRDRLARETGR